MLVLTLMTFTREDVRCDLRSYGAVLVNLKQLSTNITQASKAHHHTNSLTVHNMATKVEEANIAPVGNAGLVDGTSSEKQTEAPATASAVESTEKKVETTTEGLNDLSLAEKGETSQPSKEEPAKEEALKEEPAKEVAAPASSGEATTVAPANPPTTSATEPTSTLSWPETSPEHPLTKFYDSFEELVTKASHNEVYGIELSKSSPFHTKLILQKFLRANQNDLEKAKQQLLETLEWRKTFNPTKAATESFDKSRFGGLGYALEVEGVPESTNKKDIVTFNIYGAVKDKKATFGDLESFLRWRVGLMEKSVLKLNLKDATAPIPNFGEGPDPYQGFQIHDYLQVSFIRQDPRTSPSFPFPCL